MYHPLFFFELKPALCSPPTSPRYASASPASPPSLSGSFPSLSGVSLSQISYRADAGSAAPDIYRTLNPLNALCHRDRLQLGIQEDRAPA